MSEPNHQSPTIHYEISRYNRVLIETLTLILVFAINYAHLEWTRKRQSTWRSATVKLVFVAFLPTYVVAELLFDFVSVLITLLRIDPEVMSMHHVLKDKRRYLCSLGGMYTVADPAVEADVTAQEDAPMATTVQKRPALVNIRDAEDLRQHTRPWSIATIARIALVIITSLMVIPLEILLVGNRYSDYGIDKRLVNTIIGNVFCSLAALLILFSRSEWSLVHLTTIRPKTSHNYCTFCGKFILATLVYEIILVSTGYPMYWVAPLLLSILTQSAFGMPLLLWLANFAFWFWLFRSQIQERSRLNWSLVWSFLLTLLCLVAVSDLMNMFGDDIDRRW